MTARYATNTRMLNRFILPRCRRLLQDRDWIVTKDMRDAAQAPNTRVEVGQVDDEVDDMTLERGERVADERDERQSESEDAAEEDDDELMVPEFHLTRDQRKRLREREASQPLRVIDPNLPSTSNGGARM